MTKVNMFLGTTYLGSIYHLPVSHRCPLNQMSSCGHVVKLRGWVRLPGWVFTVCGWLIELCLSIRFTTWTTTQRHTGGSASRSTGFPVARFSSRLGIISNDNPIVFCSPRGGSKPFCAVSPHFSETRAHPANLQRPFDGPLPQNSITSSTVTD